MFCMLRICYLFMWYFWQDICEQFTCTFFIMW